MVVRSIRAALQEELPILFALIGWTRRYNGTEPVIGGHGWLQSHPEDNWEARAFEPGRTGRLSCGIGHGDPGCTRLHVVFVSRDPEDGKRKVIGVYAAADVDMRDGYPRASTGTGLLVPANERVVLGRWPGDQGVRRWAWRGGAPGMEHAHLRAWFSRFRRDTTVLRKRASRPTEDQTYADLEALEGASRSRIVAHRLRESSMRHAKIAWAVAKHGVDGLTCEVRGCGFNFAKQYGPLGNGYVHVHHRVPLREAVGAGRVTKLTDLAIVCANCHAMIHSGGGSRAVDEIRPKHRFPG